MCKIFQTNHFLPTQIHVRVKGVRNVTFLEHFAYVGLYMMGTSVMKELNKKSNIETLRVLITFSVCDFSVWHLFNIPDIHHFASVYAKIVRLNLF